jgi:hypothetical protein
MLLPRLLRDSEHPGRLGAAQVFTVSQHRHLPVNRVEAVQRLLDPQPGSKHSA